MRGCLILAGAALLVAGAAVGADYKPPRTADGAPELEGTWTNAWLTRMERGKDFTALVIPEAEAAAYDKTHAGRVMPPKDDKIGQDDSEFPEPGVALARIRGAARTSWIVEPGDGKIPYTEAAKAANKAAMEAGENDFANPESRPTDERCVGAGLAGPPLNNSADANLLQIVQTRDHVAILSEPSHNVRIIALRATAHPPGVVRQWMGDSIGHWEGETLVVETANLHPQQVRAPGAPLSDSHITERFTRTGPVEITYEFRVENPERYTQPWRGEMVLRASAAPLYEYACHEGNYGLEFILAGARQKEAAAARELATAGM